MKNVNGTICPIIVAKDNPKTPNPKNKDKTGLKIKFNMFPIIVNVVGLLEYLLLVYSHLTIH